MDYDEQIKELSAAFIGSYAALVRSFKGFDEFAHSDLIAFLSALEKSFSRQKKKYASGLIGGLVRSLSQDKKARRKSLH